MKLYLESCGKTAAILLRSWWARHQVSTLRLAIALMTLAALLRLRNEFFRLLWEPGRLGAIDLKLLHEQVRCWFAGRDVYSELRSAKLPPASYVILWPLLGWLEVTSARWLWAATTVGALAWLTYLVVRESGAATSLERGFMALLPLSGYATGATIGNGQLIVHLLPILLAGLLLLRQEEAGWGRELAAALMLVTLVKPSVSVPFFWIVLFGPGRLRPALLTTAGYVGLTLLAASFQEPGLFALINGWLARSSASAVRSGYAHLHVWLAAFGLEAWIFPSSFLTLMALGLWTYRYRREDVWVLIGVAALVARFWTYHELYDDLLIVLPAVALFRIAKRSAGEEQVVAGGLLGITWLAMMGPGRLRFFPPPLGLLFRAGQTVVWLLVLVFLFEKARRGKIWGAAG